MKQNRFGKDAFAICGVSAEYSPKVRTNKPSISKNVRKRNPQFVETAMFSGKGNKPGAVFRKAGHIAQKQSEKESRVDGTGV